MRQLSSKLFGPIDDDKKGSVKCQSVTRNNAFSKKTRYGFFG